VKISEFTRFTGWFAQIRKYTKVRDHGVSVVISLVKEEVRYPDFSEERPLTISPLGEDPVMKGWFMLVSQNARLVRVGLSRAQEMPPTMNTTMLSFKVAAW